ncbi:MAG: 5-keto-L-gluconate epimerase [bacterium]
MKLSIVLSTQPSSFSALAYKGNLSENVAKIKRFGFDGIELAVRDPDQLDVDFLRSILKDNSLPVSAIGTGQAYNEEALSFTNPQKEIRERTIKRIKSHAKLAESLNAIIIIGLVRGKKESELGYETVENWLIEALQECTSEYDCIKFAIEPINRYETNLINDVTSGLALLEKIGRTNVGLLLDTFHMNIEEPSIIKSINTARESLFHFHVADSNRWYPGAGHIDFKAIFNALAEIHYTGFVSAEILPLPDSDTAAKKTIDFLRDLLTNEL